MTPEQLHQIIDYIKEIEEALANWDKRNQREGEENGNSKFS